jgi:hypothetical protein
MQNQPRSVLQIYIAMEPYRNPPRFGDFSLQKQDEVKMFSFLSELRHEESSGNIRLSTVFLVHLQVAKKAYKSVLIITIADYINEPEPEMQTMILEWKRRSVTDYNCTEGNNLVR